jgi:hypothetical protein
MKRRVFLKTVGSAAGVAALGVPKVFANQIAENGAIPRRVLGRTGVSLSVVGFPGLALTKCDQAKGTDALHQAFDGRSQLL